MDQDISSGYGSGFGTLLLKKNMRLRICSIRMRFSQKLYTFCQTLIWIQNFTCGRVLYYPKRLFIVKILPCRRSGIEATIPCFTFQDGCENDWLGLLSGQPSQLSWWFHHHPRTSAKKFRSVNFRGGQANFFLSPQIENPQRLGLIPLSLIWKFIECASPQI